jgi:ribonuclease P protein component
MRKSLINCDKGSFRFRRKEHLKGRNEIREVFNRGKRFGYRGAVPAKAGAGSVETGAKLFVLENDLSYNRICITFSRGFGTAVVRNRARRLGREAFRLLKNRLTCGYDLILLVYPETGSDRLTTVRKMTLSDRSKQLEFLFSKAGLLK